MKKLKKVKLKETTSTAVLPYINDVKTSKKLMKDLRKTNKNRQEFEDYKNKKEMM